MRIIDSFDVAADLLLDRQVGIVPTDTIYGISCISSCESCVERIYTLKDRDFDKPFIILIPDIESLENFAVSLTEKTRTELYKYWPGRNSVVLPCPHSRFKYLHRGLNSLAFRVPDNTDLVEMLKKTGSIVSTSANYQGGTNATSIEDAIRFFGEGVDFYLDMGVLINSPSSVYKCIDGKFIKIR
jgi:L-threonylcarbamoyladenylate synthase